jgi:hypothetical protein
MVADFVGIEWVEVGVGMIVILCVMVGSLGRISGTVRRISDPEDRGLLEFA